MRLRLFILLGTFILFGNLGIISASVFGDSLDTNLQGYYSFDETSGTNVKESVNAIYNLTTYGTANFVSGKKGNSLNITAGASANETGAFYVNDTDFTISFWNLQYGAIPWYSTLITTANGGDKGFRVWATDAYNPSDKWAFSPSQDAKIYTFSNPFNDSTWHHYIITRVNDDYTFYMDGVNLSIVHNTQADLPQPIMELGRAGEIGSSGSGSRMIDELGFWSRAITEAEATTLYGVYTKTNFIVNVTYPLENTKIQNINSLFNVSLSMSGGATNNEWINNTYYIWYSNGTRKNVTTISGLSTNSTSTSKLFNINIGNYIINSYACYGNATFNNCSWNSGGNYSFSVGSLVNSNTANTLGYETGTETYTLNVTTPTGNVPTNAYLVYNGTSYSATVTASGSNYLISKTLQIASSKIGANTFYYTWNLSSTFGENSSVYNQEIQPIQFGLCNATLTVKYLNISFKDESTDGYITATIPSSTFTYYLGDGSITKTLTYINSSANYYYSFCGLPSNQTYYVDPYVQYKNGTDYPQRIWDADLGTYTNSTTNQTLYLLSSTDGIYVTFQVVNVAGQVLSGVEVNAYRTIGSSVTQVATGTTSSSGTVTFWLNPDFTHTINFTKTGYTTYTFEEPPTQTSYTISLSSATSSVEDYRQGISISRTPTNSSLEENSENDFTLTLSSSHYTLESFASSLYFGNGTFIKTYTSTTGTGGTFTFSTINITNQSIYLNYNWTINSTTINGTFYWINSGTQGREFSIWHFFQDFNMYISSGDGLLGIDNFGRGLLAIVFMVLIVGGVGYRYGFQNEAVVFGIIFGVVLFLDTMNFIPKPDFLGIVPLDNFLTIITGLIFVGFILKEEMR